MRPVSFAGLHRILHILAERPRGLSPGRLDAEVRQRRVYLTARGTLPKRTTLYHCRNALLRMGAIRRRGKELTVAVDNAHVDALLQEPAPSDRSLAPRACDLFGELVLSNRDCRTHFFDLFMPECATYGVNQLRSQGEPVAWLSPTTDQDGVVVLYARGGSRSLRLESPSEMKGILYGVRHWARDELMLIDEFFREDRGVVMYPVRSPAVAASVNEITRDIVDLTDPNEEWTMLSVKDLVARCCEQGRRPLRDLSRALERLLVRCSGEVVLVPTSRRFAVLTARSPQREQLQLRGYFRDQQGRYISHVRLHKSIREAEQCPTL